MSSNRVDLQMLESKFSSLSIFSSYVGHLPFRSSSIEVVFLLFKIFKIILSSTRVDLQMLESKFCSFPAISLLVRTGGRAGGRVLEETKLRLTQPSLVELGPGLSLAKTSLIVSSRYCLQCPRVAHALHSD